MNNVYYHGIWRMDWGLDNPNKTAALIATFMIAVWAFAYIRKWGFWIALSLFTVLGIGLIHTFSRGGIIALFFGLIPVIYFAQRPWPWNKIMGIILSVWIMVGFSIYLDASGRYEQGVIKEDRSIGNRLEIWKATPQMMVDAPHGWGIGNSGKIYMEWYQPLDHSEQYRTLVNSHLTWLVELGWPLRFLYIFSWFLIFVLCWPSKSIRAISISLGVWIAFAVAAGFSSVAESPWLWIVPVVCVVVAIVLRYKLMIWPELKTWIIPVVISGASILLIVFLGSGSTAIQAVKGGAILGNGAPSVWVVVDRKVMGQNYAHTLRQYLLSVGSGRESIGVIESAVDLPIVADKTVVIAGMVSNKDIFQAALPTAKRLVLLNPSFFPQEINITSRDDRHIAIIFGEFSQSPAANAWDAVGSVQRIAGVGDFMSHWPEFVLSIK